MRKYGTLVFRPTCDLALLSEAMWKLKQVEVQSEEKDTHVPKSAHANTTQGSDEISIEHVDRLIHTQIEKYLAADAQAPLGYEDLKLDELISNTCPDLWNAVCCLTMSKFEALQR